MKILPPTQRESYRYIAFGLTAEDNISRHDLINEIIYSTAALFGDAGSSELGIRLLSFESGRGIIRCASGKIWESRAVLACVSTIKGIRVRIKISGISGTVRAATEKYLQTQNISKAETERNETQNLKEYTIVIGKSMISGKIINQNYGDIDFMPEEQQYKDVLVRSNTRYSGITIFDLKGKEIDR